MVCSCCVTGCKCSNVSVMSVYESVWYVSGAVTQWPFMWTITTTLHFFTIPTRRKRSFPINKPQQLTHWVNRKDGEAWKEVLSRWPLRSYIQCLSINNTIANRDWETRQKCAQQVLDAFVPSQHYFFSSVSQNFAPHRRMSAHPFKSSLPKKQCSFFQLLAKQRRKEWKTKSISSHMSWIQRGMGISLFWPVQKESS